ncbi:hypothetical protein Gpo141_00008548 [Globisporangium polare]
MGCNVSIEDLTIALTPLPTPMTVIDKRFVCQEPVKLRLQGDIVGHDFDVFDMSTRKKVFRVYKPLISTHDPRTIYDEKDEPIVKLTRELGYENFYAEDAKTGKDLFKINAGIGLLYVDVDVRFKDALTGEKCHVNISGSWTPRKVLVWMVRESNLTPTPIGRIESVGNDYDVDVAPGVDLMLMMMLCATLDGALDSSSLF